jgi:hypothetical protein
MGLFKSREEFFERRGREGYAKCAEEDKKTKKNTKNKF